MTAKSELYRYRLDDIDIDLQRQRVERDGSLLDVGGLSFQLLRYLVVQGDRVVGFEELINQVWAPAVVNEETVTQRVKLLRQALGDDSRQPRYIRSVRGQGYQLCVMPQAIAALSDAAAESPSAAQMLVRARGTGKLRWGVAAVLAAGVALGAWHGWLQRAAGPIDPNMAAQSHADSTDVVLQRAAYYAGIGQRDDNERAIGLYQRVLAESPGNAAAQLGLSRSYSARVCLFNFPPEWAARAQQLAEAVIAAQPGNGRAQAALGYSYDCRGRIDAALQGYERALQRDPNDDNSRASAAYLYERKGRLADALIANTSMRGDPSRVRFLALQLASNLDFLGYPQAAEARYRRSFELYPDNVYSNIAWPRFLFRQGRLKEAQSALDEALHRGTAHMDLHLLQAELALLRGDSQAAQAACRTAAELRPQASLPNTLLLLSASSPDTDALQQRAELLAQDLVQGAGYSSDWLEVALLHEAAGNRARAVADVRRAIAGGYRDAAYLQVSPWLAGLRRDPAYAQTVDELQRALVSERAQVPPQLIAKLTASP